MWVGGTETIGESHNLSSVLLEDRQTGSDGTKTSGVETRHHNHSQIVEREVPVFLRDCYKRLKTTHLWE